MKFSKSYIKLCARSQDLQRLKIYHYPGDYVSHRGIVEVVNGYSLNEGGNEYRTIRFEDDNQIESWYLEGSEQTIWLPRQDQLQKIFLESEFNKRIGGTSSHVIIKEFAKYTELEWMSYIYDLNNETAPEVEIIWLTFVMLIKFNKRFSIKQNKWIDSSECHSENNKIQI